MPIELTADGMRKIFPQAPAAVIDAFVAKHGVLDKAGVTHTRPRLAYFFANIEHECGGFTIKNLTENTNYTAKRMAQVWPNRFPGGAGDVEAKYGTEPGWQLKALDDIYGNRMGNRPGTRDGSNFIGRGGPQWTGRDGYAALSRFLGQDAVALPALAARYDLQPEVCTAFWDWKKLNAKADVGDFKGVVRSWNGGYNGLADREAKLNGNDPYIERLKNVDRVLPIAKNDLPGSPPTPKPPKDVIDAATANERKTRKGAAASVGAGAGNEGVKAGTQVPSKSDLPLLPTPVAFGLIAVGIAVFVIACILISRKVSAVKANWF